MNYTYMLECSDGSFYIGWTNDLQKRVKTHEKGKGGKYTHSHLPVKLVYYEEFEEKRDAQSREVILKQLSHKEKEKLVKNWKHEDSDGLSEGAV